MDYNLNVNQETKIDFFELLTRFIYNCKKYSNEDKSELSLLSFADIVTAVYYYRQYPSVNDFIAHNLKGENDYFLLQWVRATWASFDKMTQEEISDIVINQITLVANLTEEA